MCLETTGSGHSLLIPEGERGREGRGGGGGQQGREEGEEEGQTAKWAGTWGKGSPRTPASGEEFYQGQKSVHMMLPLSRTTFLQLNN